MNFFRWVLVVFVCGLWVTACATAPYTGRNQLLMLSQGEENKMGRQAWREILSREKPHRTSSTVAAVERVGRKIAGVSGHPEYAWEFQTFESEQSNAFCLPGGKVAVYSGIFQYIANDAELAAIIGHEVGHALARHGGERVSQAILQQLGAEIVEVAVKEKHRENALLAYGVTTELGAMLPYSRTHEYEADHIGMILMAKAGYDPAFAVSFWEKFSKAASMPGFLEYFSTHPIGPNRIKKLKASLPSARVFYENATRKIGAGVIY